MLKRNSGHVGLGGLGKLLILITLVLSLNSCGKSLKSVKRNTIPTEPIIQTINNSTYWCVEERVFTALMQESY